MRPIVVGRGIALLIVVLVIAALRRPRRIAGRLAGTVTSTLPTVALAPTASPAPLPTADAARHRADADGRAHHGAGRDAAARADHPLPSRARPA